MRAVRVRSAGSAIDDHERGPGGGFAARQCDEQASSSDSSSGGAMAADENTLAELCARYELEIQPDTVPGLLERFGLDLGHPVPGGWRP